jgi:hypothetical protein
MARVQSRKASKATEKGLGKKKMAAFTVIAAVAAVTVHLAGNSTRQPLMNGSFKGEHWLKELLAGTVYSPIHILDLIYMYIWQAEMNAFTECLA